MNMKTILSTALTLSEVPSPGQKVSIEAPGTEFPTEAEITEVVRRGGELWATIKAAGEDGKWTFAEIMVIVVKTTEVAGLSIWQKIGRFIKGLFGK